MIIADTGVMVTLIDADEQAHETVQGLYDLYRSEWVLPWAVLPEVDYLLSARLGAAVEEKFLDDLTDGVFAVEWSDESDLVRAREICKKHRALKLGLVDGVVMAMAERLKADAIATLDVRHFGAVKLKGAPRLLPRDL